MIMREMLDRLVGASAVRRTADTKEATLLGGPPSYGAMNEYATRASRLLIAHAFETLDVHRVTILVSVHNERSQRVAERLAGPPEAVLRDRLHVRNQWHDACVYGVIAPGS